MNIDVTKLNKGLVGSIKINDKIDIPKELINDSDIKQISKVLVTGEIVDAQEYGYEINLILKGNMSLTCALSLEEVDYPFEIEVQENIKSEENLKNDPNILDIMPIIWENIVLEKPIRVVKENAKLENIEGDGWKLDLGDEERIDPRLEKLNELLKEEEK